ncbi:hypothetical protein O3P69_004911 [Scylla paramamosain]|uniref:Transmembrane protein 68 n=1 Tax=Scylla paramamosain TaxID=85552 RepID=A0AAW0UE20_SCYPA
MTCDDSSSFCALVKNVTLAASAFIGQQMDLLYLGWVWSLVFPALLVVVVLPCVILLLLYFSAFLLYVFQRRRSLLHVLHESLEHRDPWAGGRYLISLIWDAHGYIWHGYEVRGLENLPDRGRCLIIYYHGAIPIDIYYLVAHSIIVKGRLIHCVGDRFLEKVPGWKVILEAFDITAGTISSCIKTLSEDHILSISPGGAMLKWPSELMPPSCQPFTENIREAFRVVAWPQRLWVTLYEKLRFPCAPIYGGFPVKLRTHLGEPIYPKPGESPEELAERIQESLAALIRENQKLPGRILRALMARVYEAPKQN